MGNQTLRSLLLWGQEATRRGGNYRSNFLWDCVKLTDSPEVVAAAQAVQESDRATAKLFGVLLGALSEKADLEDPRLRIVEILDELEGMEQNYKETTWIHVGVPALYLEWIVKAPQLDGQIAAQVSALAGNLRAYGESRGKDDRDVKSDKPRLALFREIAQLKTTIAQSLA